MDPVFLLCKFNPSAHTVHSRRQHTDKLCDDRREFGYTFFLAPPPKEVGAEWAAALDCRAPPVLPKPSRSSRCRSTTRTQLRTWCRTTFSIVFACKNLFAKASLYERYSALPYSNSSEILHPHRYISMKQGDAGTEASDPLRKMFLKPLCSIVLPLLPDILDVDDFRPQALFL